LESVSQYVNLSLKSRGLLIFAKLESFDCWWNFQTHHLIALIARGIFKPATTPSTLDISFPWKPVWRSKVPPRVAFFSWTASLGKILTTENLWYKGVAVVDWCYMCKKSGESVNHLLLHCPIAYDLWSMVWALFGLQWVMPHGVSDFFSSWQGSFGGHRSIDLWRAVPHCVLWCIWRERNSRCFEGKERSTSDLKSLLLHSLLEWSASFNLFPCSNFLEMLDLCNLCV